ncbi:actin-related protein ArpC1, partial [Volvox carteri f. nagariensis]
MTSSVQHTRLPGPIQAIAWNRDCTSIAVSHLSNDLSHASHDVIIYEITFTPAGQLSWSKVAVLKGHEQLVSGLHWAPGSDQILSCSYDRNAFGGRVSGPPAAAQGPWEKQMVITRLTKGALCVRWSPSETKFAIGSAARVVSVGYYDKESNWWACKMIRKAHESSVVCVSWHPNSLLLATGSTDKRVRLFNAYMDG